MKKSSLPLFALCGLILAGFAAAADWPQWRGPNRDDVSKETGLLPTWPKEGPKLLWTFRDAGEGYSGPAIVGDMLYCMGADDKSEFIYAVDLKTQTKKWTTPMGSTFTEGHGDGPRGTPTVDGDLVYGVGGQGDLICVKASTGEKVWMKEFKKELGGESMSDWGYTESPLVDGAQVVCTPGGKEGTIAAFDKKTGDVLWRTKGLSEKAAYSSIVAAEIAGARQYVQMTGESVVGVNPKDGAILWRYARSGPTAAIPTPIVSGDQVFVTSGYGAGCNLIKITADGGKFKAEEIYREDEPHLLLANHHGGVVLVDGFLYGHSDGAKGRGPARWMCQELKTGKVLWPKSTDDGKPGKDESNLGKGSLTYADGCLYCYGENDGAVVLVQASPEGWKEKGRFALPEKSQKRSKSGKFWTHPVVANGKLYLRDQDLLLCYDVKGGSASR